ncbi:MAG: type II CAAX endopeptidase family protein [Caenibius sp.]
MTTARPTEHEPSGMAIWIAVAGGLLAGWAWLQFAQRLGDTIEIDSLVALMAIFYGLVFAPLILLALVLGWFCHNRIAWSGPAPLRAVAVGAMIGSVGLAFAAFYGWLNGGMVTGAGAAAATRLLLFGLLLTCFQAGAEEVFFRGWLQPVLVARIGATGGVLLAAVLFSLFHLVGSPHEPLALVNLALGGLLFGVLALRSGGLAAPAAAHVAWNATEDLGLGLVPNPGTGPLGALVDLDLMGSSWWGGSPEGLNASIGTTLVLLALILLSSAIRWHGKTSVPTEAIAS